MENLFHRAEWSQSLGYCICLWHGNIGTNAWSFLKGYPRDPYYVSDKLTPQCMDEYSETSVKDMLDAERGFLGIDDMDIYWVHNPVGAPKWITALARYFEGKENLAGKSKGMKYAEKRILVLVNLLLK